MLLFEIPKPTLQHPPPPQTHKTCQILFHQKCSYKLVEIKLDKEVCKNSITTLDINRIRIRKNKEYSPNYNKQNWDF